MKISIEMIGRHKVRESETDWAADKQSKSEQCGY